MKHREVSKPPQGSLLLRLLGGGYLLYLAYGLIDAARNSLLYTAALALFASMGVVLLVHSGVKLYRKEFTRPNDATQNDTTTHEEESDEQ